MGTDGDTERAVPVEPTLAVSSFLRDVPGVDPVSLRRRRRPAVRQAARRAGRLAGGGRSPGRDRAANRREPDLFHDRRRRVELGTIFAWLVALGTLAFVSVLVYRSTRVEVHQRGLEDGATLNVLAAAAMEVTIEFSSEDQAEQSTLSFDGEPVENVEPRGDRMVWRPPPKLAEGRHTLSVLVPRTLLGDARIDWAFTVDATAPTVDVPPLVDPVGMNDPVTIEGRVEAGARLTAAKRGVDVDEDGRFSVRLARPPAGPIAFAAVDAAGNRATASVIVPVTYPGMRGVHVSAAAWGSPSLRGGIVALIDQRRIDTVVLDLKDDTGTVGYDSAVSRAHEIGAVSPLYDLEDAVTDLEARGARVVGRIVTFRDPTLAQAAWNAGQADQVIRAPDGSPHESTGWYTNFAHPAVRQYNLDLAREAVARGVDDILWDEVRRPSGDPSDVVVPGLNGSASDGIAGFLAEAHAALRARGAFSGVTVDGAAADQGDLMGQDVARLARHADYMAPMMYPGYRGPGEYGVQSPVNEPYEISRRVMQRFQRVTSSSGIVLAPWLQDFRLRGVTYGEGEVRAQIDAVRSLGIDRFLLWDPSVTYTAAALDPM